MSTLIDLSKSNKLTVTKEIFNFSSIIILVAILYAFTYFNIIRLFFSYPEYQFDLLIDLLLIVIAFLISLILQVLITSHIKKDLINEGYTKISDEFKKLYISIIFMPLLYYLIFMVIAGHTYEFHKLAVFTSLAVALAILVFLIQIQFKFKKLKFCEINN